MEVSETVFWFVVVPAFVVLVIGGLAYAFGGDRRDRRYRPGRPYEAAPVWYLSAPGGMDDVTAKLALPERGARSLETSAVAQDGRVAPQGATGGASDSW